MSIIEEKYMEFVSIDPTDEKGIEVLSSVATDIVGEYYEPLLGSAQNEYMLRMFQSVEAIREQMAQGYTYWLCDIEGRHVGFVGVCMHGDVTYLSKLYLHKSERGKGYGRAMMRLVIDFALSKGSNGVELNVNKHNPTITIYEKMGFRRIRSEKNDIGNGYYMDDYVYRYDIRQNANKE